MRLGAKIKEKFTEKVLKGLSQRLYAGEYVDLLVKTNKVSPALDAIVVTTGRVLAFSSMDVAKKGPKIAVYGDQVAEALIHEKRFGSPSVELVTHDGEKLALGVMTGDSADAALVRDAIDALRARDLPDHVLAGRAAAAEAATQAAMHAEATAPDAWYDGVTFVGQLPSDKAHRILIEHSAANEKPWLVIGNGIAGVLAAFDDRLLIVKVGGMTSLMAGSFGGGRITTFTYTDITGIEYNSGMVSGVLEILTPSYQGTANKDYWNSGDNNDPYQLSNTLPLPKHLYTKAAPHLATLRQKVAESKRPVVTVTGDVGGPGMAEEIRQLAALREQGLLDDAEFTAAKRAAIDRHTAKPAG